MRQSCKTQTLMRMGHARVHARTRSLSASLLSSRMIGGARGAAPLAAWDEVDAL